MDSITLAVVFFAVWLGLVFLYCAFRICGGRAVDFLSCDCFVGPCSDCWGAGGQIDTRDQEYPDRFRHPPSRFNPYNQPQRQPQQPQLPPIVIINNGDRDGKRRSGSDDDSSSDDDESSGSLILSSKRAEKSPNAVIVV